MLEEVYESSQKEYHTLLNKLKHYESVSGPEFDKLVEQYRIILQDIQHKKWALQEMKSSGLQDSPQKQL